MFKYFPCKYAVLIILTFTLLISTTLAPYFIIGRSASGQTTDVVINEFLPRPAFDWDDDGEFTPNGDEFIELFNPTSTNIDLSGWVLDDEEGGTQPYIIPEGTHILSKDYLLYYGSMTGIALNNDKDTVRLLDSSGNLIDSYSYTWPKRDVSYIRVPDGGNLWNTSKDPSPSASISYLEYMTEYVLRGRLVTMNSESLVIEDGYVLIEEGMIKDIWDAEQDPPSGVTLENMKVIETNGLIFPGLIDLHNHIAYNTLPLWNVPKLYGNRYQWTSHPTYKTDVSWPKKLLTGRSYYDLEAEVIKYAEVKALVGGTTAIQGSPGQRSSYDNILVRNVELRNFGVDKVYQYVMPVDSVNEEYYLERISDGRLDSIFFHIAEGIDSSSRAEFFILEDKGLVVEELIVIHGTNLSQKNLEAMGNVGAKLVWSPLSNLLLYGNTTDVVSAWNSGVIVSLAPDWSPSGSKNILGELKIASLWNEFKLDGFFSDHQLIQMVTTNPAKTLNWSDLVGRVEVGLHADLLVIKDPGGNPYTALIRATDEDVLLVTVDGDPLYGRWDWLEQIKPGDWEVIGCTGLVRGLDVTFSSVPKATQNWTEIVNLIMNAMNFDAWIDSNEYPGLHSIELTPLFASCDPDFFESINNSSNANLPFNLWEKYYAAIELDTDGDNIPDSSDLDDDNDGLGDNQEDELNTDPFSPDTDRDHTIDSKDFYPLDSTRSQREDDLVPYAVAGGALSAIVAGGYYYYRHRRSL